MRKILALLALLALVSPAEAQKTKAAITTEINSFFADNTTGQITPAKLRTVTTDIVNSYVDWLTCAGTGSFVYWDAGVPTCINGGTAGQFLRTAGTAAAPSWADATSLLTAGTGITITGTTPATIGLTNQITAGGPVGSATVTPVVTYNAQGQLTTVTSATIAPPFSAVTGTAVVTQGGTGLTGGTSGGVPYFNSTTTMASSALLTANAFMIGGGAGGSPTTVAITGLVLGNGASAPTAYGGTTCTNQFVRALNASGAATCSTVSLTADVTGTLPVGNGGTGATTITSMMDTAFSSTQGSVLYRNASAWVALGPGTSGQLLSSGGPAANPSWITASGTGTVTSVAAGGGLSASPSPITGSGTLSLRTPTVQILTSGTGATYTTPAGVAYIHVKGCGGGGGGGTTAGGTGGTTSFSASTMSATGGAGSSGTGGAAAAGGTGTNGQINYTGGAGMGTVTTTGAMFMPIMPGGASFMFPATASAPGANTCTGAPTAQTATSGANTGGAGGGGGGFERVIGSPAASYTYTIGAGGTAGTSGIAGGSGVIIVWEY